MDVPLATLDYAPRPEFDTGRFVARYFQVLACLMIMSMILAPVFFDSFSIDPSPIFLFWAASALKRRSRTARKWVLALGGLMLAAFAMALVEATVSGTAGMTVKVGLRQITNPPFLLFVLITVLGAGVVAVPFVVLLSASARRQFNAVASSTVDTEELADRLSNVR